MKYVNIVTLLLIIIGAVNWLCVGLLDVDLVATIFGTGTALTNLIYILVGISGLYQLVPFFAAMNRGEVDAEANTTGTGSRINR
jgi:hypothetical protein